MNRIAGNSRSLRLRPVEAEDEQLLKLFWNRAELKKELGRLRRDRDQMIEQIRQQENLTLRVQQRLDQLEHILADPLEAANAAVYYQLRRVGQLCNRRLSRLARELADRQREREEQRATALRERDREARLASLDEEIAALDRRVRAADTEWQRNDEQIRRWRGFWNYFRRRAVAERNDTVRASLEGLAAQRDARQSERRQMELEPAPGFAGISVSGRRNINAVLIAMAQQLYLHFAESDIAALAREAGGRGLAELSYGNVAECRALSEAITAVTSALEQADRLNSRVRRRAEFLQRVAQYRDDNATVPAAGSLDSIPLRIADTGEPGPADGNVVAVDVVSEDYWELNAILLG